MQREERTIYSIKKNSKNILPLKCPACGAKLQQNDDNSAICPYCDVKILIQGNNSIQEKDIIPPSIEQLEDGTRETKEITKVQKKKHTITHLLSVLSTIFVGYTTLDKCYELKISDNMILTHVFWACVVAFGLSELFFNEIIDIDENHSKKEKENERSK
jgi:DNA-directed RNA polymerase subunit RPC12/RpoP